MEYHPIVFLKRKLRLRRVQRARRGFPKSPPSPPTPAGSQAPSDGAGNCGLCPGWAAGPHSPTESHCRFLFHYMYFVLFIILLYYIFI